MKIAAVAAALALASPLAAFAQAPGPVVTRTVVTHEATHSGPVVTKTTYRVARHHHHHRRHHYHHVVRQVVTHGPAGTKTVTVVKR